MNGSFRKLLSAKIHRATVTQADVDYEGSITIPPDLLSAADIHPYESVCVWNVDRGSRLETYAITGLPGSRDICANGAAAHLIRPGDRVIIASYRFVAEDQLADHRPRLIFVDEQNRIAHRGPEIAGPRVRGDSSESATVDSAAASSDVNPSPVAAPRVDGTGDAANEPSPR
jgi:aspartate 1-decarboxylase